MSLCRYNLFFGIKCDFTRPGEHYFLELLLFILRLMHLLMQQITFSI